MGSNWAWGGYGWRYVAETRHLRLISLHFLRSHFKMIMPNQGNAIDLINSPLRAFPPYRIPQANVFLFDILTHHHALLHSLLFLCCLFFHCLRCSTPKGTCLRLTQLGTDPFPPPCDSWSRSLHQLRSSIVYYLLNDIYWPLPSPFCFLHAFRVEGRSCKSCDLGSSGWSINWMYRYVTGSSGKPGECRWPFGGF